VVAATLPKNTGGVVFFPSGIVSLVVKVMNVATHHNDRYSGEPPISSMTKSYVEAAVEIAQEAGKILVEELSRPLDLAYKGDEVDFGDASGQAFREIHRRAPDQVFSRARHCSRRGNRA